MTQKDSRQDPQIHMIPATDEALGQLIVAEANYDRWSNFLFPHSKSGDLYGRRKQQWSVTLPNGAEKSARIEIIPAQDEKCYTTKTYDVFLALTEIWKARGMTDQVMEIYLGDIAKVLDLKENGRVVNMIIEELRCLYDTKVSWVFSFHTSQGKDDTYKNQRVLEVFDYVQKSERNIGRTKTTCSVRLSEHIRLNIKNNITIAVNFAARKKIRSSIAKALYSRLDNFLMNNIIYVRPALGLIDDLNITPGRYKYKSQRKILLNKLQKSLNGAELSQTGSYLQVKLEETTDKKDWQCIVTVYNSANAVLENSGVNAAPKDSNNNSEIEALQLHYLNYYSAALIQSVILEWRDTISKNQGIVDQQKYFSSLMHITAHKKGLNWVQECGAQCKFRPENLAF